MKRDFEESIDENKLKLLQEADPIRLWKSLDETRHCILCEKVISGHDIQITRDRRNFTRLRCPTPGCCATPAEWVHPGNPLLSEDAWRDWVKMLDSLCDEELSQRRPVRRFRPNGNAPNFAMTLGHRITE